MQNGTASPGRTETTTPLRIVCGLVVRAPSKGMRVWIPCWLTLVALCSAIYFCELHPKALSSSYVLHRELDIEVRAPDSSTVAK